MLVNSLFRSVRISLVHMEHTTAGSLRFLHVHKFDRFWFFQIGEGFSTTAELIANLIAALWCFSTWELRRERKLSGKGNVNEVFCLKVMISYLLFFKGVEACRDTKARFEMMKLLQIISLQSYLSRHCVYSFIWFLPLYSSFQKNMSNRIPGVGCPEAWKFAWLKGNNQRALKYI